jgi:hypothetical protein
VKIADVICASSMTAIHRDVQDALLDLGHHISETKSMTIR